jgi:hypothetical protein
MHLNGTSAPMAIVDVKAAPSGIDRSFSTNENAFEREAAVGPDHKACDASVDHNVASSVRHGHGLRGWSSFRGIGVQPICGVHAW